MHNDSLCIMQFFHGNNKQDKWVCVMHMILGACCAQSRVHVAHRIGVHVVYIIGVHFVHRIVVYYALCWGAYA